MSDALVFRDFDSQNDWEIVVRLRNLSLTHHPGTVDEAIQSNEVLPHEYRPQRVIINLEKEPVAYLVIQEAFWLQDPGRVEGRVFFHPEFETAERYDEILSVFEQRAASRGAQKFSLWERSTRPEGIRVVESRGYVETQRNNEGYVPITSLNADWVRDSAEQVSAAGYTMLTLAEYAEKCEDWLPKYYRLMMDIMRDVPLPEPFQDVPYEIFEKDMKTFDLELIQLAMDPDGNLAGMSGMEQNKADALIGHTSLTGVLPEHRRKGLARALKLTLLARAQARGIQRVTTDNEQKNPMYLLNLQLGFVNAFEWICYEKSR